MKLLNKLLISIIILKFGSVVKGQSVEEYKRKYAGYHELILKDLMTYKIGIKSNKLDIRYNLERESMILAEEGVKNNSESIHYSELVSLKDWNAFSLNIVNEKIKKVPISKIYESADNSDNIFYDDAKKKEFNYTDLNVGSIKHLDYELELKDPFILPKLIFAWNFPILKSIAKVEVDENIEIGYKIFNDPKGEIKVLREVKKGKIIYSFSAGEKSPIKWEDNSQSYLYIIPHVIIFIKSYKIDGKDIQKSGTTDLLYSYYKQFTDDLNITPSENLKNKVLELIKDKTTELEKIKKIYYWVKDNIKYVAFEYGYEGYKPRQADFVYEHRYGDCKDMASIISSMCNLAGIKDVNIAWIGSRELPYSYEDIPTSDVDNHMIAYYNAGDSIYILDATDSETKLGLPSSFIQGKQAMLKSDDGFSLYRIPIVEPEENKFAESIELNYRNGLLEGKGICTMEGLTRSSFISRIGNKDGKERFEYIKRSMTKGNNKFILKNYTEKGIENKDLPYQIKYDFAVGDYAIKNGKETYVNLFLVKTYEDDLLNEDRTGAYEFSRLIEEDYTIDFNFPESMTWKSIPENSSFENALFHFDKKYFVSSNKISLQYNIKLKKLIVNKELFPLWNESIQKLKNSYTENIILIEKN